ncbi:MAG: acyltransferase [Paracoccus sp. (in: a-proteobacteria)]|uniref:acyltransferase family protein n=1 Tax=Paracoccus sp. TaxID=267 RepID=UPI0026DF9126|nr:acyltransferase [Paracoccus sp. (in: a-proteobacteria)]MDO5630958.1 acyltransferase [Paracoccus sp. (in: a-proteobacteria)]
MSFTDQLAAPVGGYRHSAQTTAARHEGVIDWPLFDWLRLVLASVVVIGHAGAGVVGDYGNLAVQVFFALSGWLIGGILMRADVGDIPRFYFNRATRIWIPFLVCVLTLYAVAILKGGYAPRYLEFLLYDLTFTHNLFIPKTPDVIAAMPMQGTGAHFWSIAVEEQFYLAAPFLILMLPAGRSVLLWAMIAALMVWQQGWYGSIAMGVLAAALAHQFGDWHLRRWAWLGLGVLMIATFAGFSANPSFYALLAPLFSVAVVLLCARPGRRGPVGKFFGAISFPVYLWHWVGLFGANMVWKMGGFDPSLRPAVGYALSLMIGAVAWMAIDRPVMQLRNQWYSPALGQTLMAAAFALLLAGLTTAMVLQPLR